MTTVELVSLLSTAGLTLKEIVALQPSDIRLEHTFLGRAVSRAIPKEAAARVLKTVDGSGKLRDRTMVRMALYVGARQVELRRLRPIDLERTESGMYATLTGKGGRRRKVWLPGDLSFLCALLSAQRPPAAPIFGLRSKPAVWRLLSHYLRAAEVEASPHALRHTSATWLLDSGATLEEAMEILGHSEASSHEVYAAASQGWFLGQWMKYHPLADADPVAYIYIAGEQYKKRMARGVERLVPVPMETARSLSEHIPTPPYRSIINKFARASDTNPSKIREETVIRIAEAGAHPFFISMLMGVTPDHVLNSKWHRRGPIASTARANALERAIRPAYVQD